MAPRFDSGTTDALRLSSGILDYNAAYTIMAWVYPVSNPSADMQPFSIAVDGSNLDQIRTGSSATSWSARSIVGGAAIASGTFSVDYTTWQHLALVRTDSSNVYLWKDGSQSTASNQAAGGRSAATQLDAGNGRAGTTPMNGRMYAIKAWTVALSTAEILQEMRSVRPVRLANLWGWWPARAGSTERLKDYSGNGRSFTEVGTLTDEDAPPIWWGTRPRKAGHTRAPINLIVNRSSTSSSPDTPSLRIARAGIVNRTSTSTTPDVVILRRAMPAVVNLSSTSSTPDTVVFRRTLPAVVNLSSTSSTPNTINLISLVAFVVARTSTSTTPDTTALLMARATAVALTSASTTPDVAVLLRAMATVVAASSTSSTPDVAVLIRTFGALFNRSSTSSTPDTAVVQNLVPLLFGRASTSSTPDTSALPVARALLMALLSRSTTPDLLYPRTSHVFTVAAADVTSTAKRSQTFAIPAESRASTAARTMIFTVPAELRTSEA